jgi:sulfur carrier protein
MMDKMPASGGVDVRINGREESVPPNLNLVQLVAHLGLKGNRIAIEVNRKIVKRDRWTDCAVQSGDVIEIVHFVGGGSREE